MESSDQIATLLCNEEMTTKEIVEIQEERNTTHEHPSEPFMSNEEMTSASHNSKPVSSDIPSQDNTKNLSLELEKPVDDTHFHENTSDASSKLEKLASCNTPIQEDSNNASLKLEKLVSCNTLIQEDSNNALSKLEDTKQNTDQITTQTMQESISDDHSSVSDTLSPTESKDPSFAYSSPEHKSLSDQESEYTVQDDEETLLKAQKRGKRHSKALSSLKQKSVRLKHQLSASFSKKREDDLEEAPTVKPLSPIVGTEWDPTCLLEELYSDYRHGTRSAGKSGEIARCFGYLHKLPMNKSKVGLGKGFKRRYFRAMEGKLYYYEERSVEKALGFVRLEQSRIVPLPDKLQIQVIQKDGKSLMVKAADLDDFGTWQKNLFLEAAHPTLPAPSSPLPLQNQNVVIIDIGSASVRAGYASDDAYPELFFPAVATLDPSNQEDMGCGIAALQPEVRYESLQIYPRKVSRRMDQRDSNSQLRALDSIISYIITTLDFDPMMTQLILTLSPTVPEKDRVDLIELLFETYGFAGLCVQEQAILALYSYNTTSGIVVDIGDHIDIIPIIDGYVIEAGVTRLPFGGSAITESLSKLITARGIRYFSEIESYIIRLVKESLCFVAENYSETRDDCERNPVTYTNAMDVDRFQLPDHRKVITLDGDRFKASEGLFTPSFWGKDVLGLHDHVWKAIQACPIDQRRQLAKSIYLSGGCTLLPGLPERLQKELNVLAGPGLPVEVHAGPSRQHAAFIGASILSSLSSFRRVNVVMLEEWSEKGVDSLDKWKTT